MGKEHLLIGSAGIILGIAILVKTHKIIPALIPFLIGLAIIAFSKQENKIEQRRDRK